MEKRECGSTGMNLSLLGFGGFHLIDITTAEADKLLNAYLDRGGNYIETAARYADGNSERKIGASVSGRRKEFHLASKIGHRTREDAAAELERTLKNLRTDYLDVLFVHAMQDPADLDILLGPGGAMEHFLQAKRDGVVKNLAVSAHGRPDALLPALKSFDFDLLMTGFNYLDRFNFPQLEEEIIPLAQNKGMGILAMKSLADGFLYKSAKDAVRYTMSLPVSTVVMGMNNMQMLQTDFDIIENESPMTDAEKTELYKNAPELGNYVCRLCGNCKSSSFDPLTVFQKEALFDRQMDSRAIEDTGMFALQERLKHWFGQKEKAKAEYASLEKKVNPKEDYSMLNEICPHGIDIDRKLKIAHEKLSDSEYLS